MKHHAVASQLLAILAVACQPAEPPPAAPDPSRPEPPPAAPASATPGGADAAGSTPSAPAPGSWGLSPPPEVPLDRWLGRRRADIETELGRAGTAEADDWAAYGETWSLRYEQECAVELRSELGEGLDCEQAATLTGFAGCPGATRQGSVCVWPGRFLTARFDPASGVFRVRLEREGRSCPPAGGD